MAPKIAFLTLALILTGQGCTPSSQTPSASSDTDVSAVDVPQNQTPSACDTFDAAANPDLKCYSLGDGSSVLYPSDWGTPGQGDSGVFEAQYGAEAWVDYKPMQFMSPEMRDQIGQGDIAKYIELRRENLCGQTDACAELIDTSPLVVGNMDATLYHHRTPGLSLDNRDGHLDEYLTAIFANDTYYEMRIVIPSTVAEKGHAELLGEFTAMAESLSL